MSRGVSEVISALLLIAIVFSLGSFLYIFYSNSLQLERARYEYQFNRYRKVVETCYGVTWYQYNSTSSTLTLYIFNYGDVDIRIVRIYVDGSPYDVNILLNPDSMEKVDLASSLESGLHDIVIVSEEGYRSEIEIRI